MGVCLGYGPCKRFVSGVPTTNLVRRGLLLASRAMRGAAVRGALIPGAAAALCFAALFLSAGSSQSRLFWIGTAAALVAAIGWALQPPTLPRAAVVFFVGFAAFVLWQAASIAWSIEPARSWDYANRSLVYLFLDEQRLQSIGVLAVAWIVGACVAGAGLLLPGVSDDGQAHSVRVHDGLLFGLALVVGAAVVALALRYVVKRAVNAAVVRVVAVALVAVILGALVASVVRAGGPGSWGSDRWHEFSNPVSAQLSNAPGRVVSTSSSNRWRWWQEAWNAFTDQPAQGTGAGTFGLTDRIERNSPLAVVEPHSTPLQFLTELGLIGFLLYGAVLGAIARGTVLPLGLAIAVCVVQSFVDIDWDYIAVQGPLFLLVGALIAGPPAARRGWVPAVAAGVCALAAIYSLASPWLSDERYNAALDSVT